MKTWDQKLSGIVYIREKIIGGKRRAKNGTLKSAKASIFLTNKHKDIKESNSFLQNIC
jgi:hypothetical protein